MIQSEATAAQWPALIPTTIEHVKLAHEIFGAEEPLTPQQILELASKYKSTKALREYYISRPSFRNRHRLLVRRLLQESIRHKRQNLTRIDTELTELRGVLSRFAQQTDMAIRDTVRVLEVIAVISKAGEDLRSATRKERALSREVQEQRRRIEELSKNLDYAAAGSLELNHD